MGPQRIECFPAAKNPRRQTIPGLSRSSFDRRAAAERAVALSARASRAGLAGPIPDRLRSNRFASTFTRSRESSVWTMGPRRFLRSIA